MKRAELPVLERLAEFPASVEEQPDQAAGVERAVVEPFVVATTALAGSVQQVVAVAAREQTALLAQGDGEKKA